MLRWARELCFHDRGENEVPEGAASLPALEAGLRDRSRRTRPRGETRQAGEPVDPPEPVATPPSPLGVEEVVGQNARFALVEAEAPDPLVRLARVQGVEPYVVGSRSPK